MSAPYRRAGVGQDSSEPRSRDASAGRDDDRVLGALMIVLGGIRVVLGLVQHEHFGFEATLAAVVACAGCAVFPWRVNARDA